VPAAAVIPSSLTPSPVPLLEERNLFGEADRIAARTASASTRCNSTPIVIPATAKERRSNDSAAGTRG